MAETVKKSRIVSETDENLEEALMEEFNMRLKSCMSQDDLQVSEHKDVNQDFIRAEQEHYYEEPVETNGIQKQNGYHRDEEEDSVYENVGHQTNKTETEKTDQYIDMTITSCQSPTKPEEVYEDVGDRPNLTLTDLSEASEVESVDVKSAKDRMLLSTDVGSCLLFTQTVTSPMLTPSEENIDFLKGFRRESTNGESESVEDDKKENVYENTEFLKQRTEDNIYENLKDVKENIYENLKEGEKQTEEVIYQNVGELRELEKEEVEEENVSKSEDSDSAKIPDEVYEETKGVDILRQINKFEEESTQVTESYVETTTFESHSSDGKALKKKKSKKSRKEEKENISVKSSFNKFDALQKQNVLHIRSSDSLKAQEKFNGAQVDTSNCRSCGKAVFQMEQIKAEKAVWHKNCFRCAECNKQLSVDTYQSNEGTVYCKPHFKALFAPKAVEDDTPPSDKPDLGLEELHSLNVKERFQVFEQHQSLEDCEERTPSAVNVKRSPSILSKLAKFQSKGMDIGVADDSLNGIPIEESSSEEEEEEEEVIEGEDADLIRAKRVQKEKPFHFTGMSDVKSKWEHGDQLTARDERREERKQEIQSIRNRLFMGKQKNMKEAYQQAVMESESCVNLRKEQAIESCDTKSLKERFEKGELVVEKNSRDNNGEEEVYESEISKKSRSLFLELDANASKAPQITPVVTPKIDVKKARDNYIQKQSSEDTVKSSVNVVEDVQIQTADIQQRFKFFETYREPEKERRAFRITPPREGQVKAPTPDRDVYRDPEIVRSEEVIEDSVVAKQSHTATKMLSKFRQMEEGLVNEPQPTGPKPLKRFTPPPEPTKPESSSEAESGSEEETEDEDEADNGQCADADLLEAQKAARAKQLRAKFERWEANEIQREQNNSTVNIIEEFGEEQSQIESTKTLRARFESMRESSTENRQPRVKVNRFVELPSVTETCESCNAKVYPLEKISVHNHIYHKRCFKCMECNCVLRMDSYSYNQGLLYCTPHFKRLFISKGNYDTAFGLGQHKEKWNATVA